MLSIAALWLPIVLGAVFVFVVSSLIHMVFKYHRGDFAPVPNEDAARAALRGLPPGQYAIPCPGDMKAMKEPAWLAKYNEGPVVFLQVRPNGLPNMGKHLVQWFVFSLGIDVFVAYLTSRTLGPGTAGLQVFRFAATIAWLGYGGALVWAGIWKAVPWSKVWKDVFDALVYAVATGAAFAAFWPK